MAKKTLAERLAEDPSVQFYQLFKGGDELLFICYEGSVQGSILKDAPYELTLSNRKEVLNKTEIFYFYTPDQHGAIQKAIEIDKKLAKQKLPPLYKARDRKFYRNSLIRNYSQEGKPMKVTMRNGHILTGLILSFGVYSFLLMSGPHQIMVLKHSIHDLDYA